jgi:hypothetical protein
MFASLAVVCICVIIFYMWYGRGDSDLSRFDFGASLCFFVVLGLLAASTLLVPLTAWDARSIWFFHAKMIYFAGGLVKEGGWTAPCCAFSHTDYPLLVPVLAAQSAKLAGFWNEQLPKSALVLLLVPPLAVTVSYWKAGFATAALLLLIWARLVPQSLTNGYMDAPLALYGVIGVLLIGSWLSTGNRLDLVTGVVFASVTLGLKNEGGLLATTLLVCATPAATLASSRGQRQLLPADQFEVIELGAIILFAVASGVSWLILRRVWGLQNDLHLGISSLPSILQRLKDPDALQLILHDTVISTRLFYAWLMAICAIGLRLLLRAGPLIESVFCMAVGSVYLAGIELIYLATPLDLKWHLGSSADRTTLLPALLFLAPAILLFRDYRCWKIAVHSVSSAGTN